jgi:hypothetical protein
MKEILSRTNEEGRRKPPILHINKRARWRNFLDMHLVHVVEVGIILLFITMVVGGALVAITFFGLLILPVYIVMVLVLVKVILR